jgi:hypothetical protein
MTLLERTHLLLSLQGYRPTETSEVWEKEGWVAHVDLSEVLDKPRVYKIDYRPDDKVEVRYG